MGSKQLVVAYDASASSRDALDWALDEAERRHAGILLVNAGYAIAYGMHGFVTYVDPATADLREAADLMLASVTERAKAEHPTVEIETRFLPGNPAPVLLALLEEMHGGAELAVLGSRGLGGFSELLVGSTSLQVAAHAPCPVVVVRDGGGYGAGATGPVEPGPEVGRVVVGVDGSPASAEAVALAFEEASLRGVGLTALHVWDAPFFEARGRGGPIPERVVVEEFAGEEMRALSESLAGWREKYPDVAVRQVVEHGDAVATLVAASAGAAMLVVGSRGRGGFRSLVLGSVSHALLHHAYCPVAVARHRG